MGPEKTLPLPCSGTRQPAVATLGGEALEERQSTPSERRATRMRRRGPGGVRAGEPSMGRSTHCDAANRRSCVAIGGPAARSLRSAPSELRSAPSPGPQGPPITNRRSARCVSPSCSHQTRFAIRYISEAMQPSGRTNVPRRNAPQLVEREGVATEKWERRPRPDVAIRQRSRRRSVAFLQHDSIGQHRRGAPLAGLRG